LQIINVEIPTSNTEYIAGGIENSNRSRKAVTPLRTKRHSWTLRIAHIYANLLRKTPDNDKGRLRKLMKMPVIEIGHKGRFLYAHAISQAREGAPESPNPDDDLAADRTARITSTWSVGVRLLELGRQIPCRNSPSATAPP
jgi:hypothetical protein